MNSPLPPDPYKALGVELNADAATIKTAYRKLVLKCHPDKFPDPTMKALKQDEFQRVQQAYEILGNEDKRKEYDLEVEAKRLKEELNKRGGSTANGPSGGRYFNVNVRTAEPPPGWSPSSKHSPPKSSSNKPYSGLFSQSWENEIPSRSKAHYDEGRTARRAASYEKPKREDSRERRRRFEEDRERDRRRDQDDEDLRKERRQRLAKEKERELRERDMKERERERARKREREDRESRAREHEARLKAEAKAEKKRERERAEREAAKRKQDADEKMRAKSKPYVEPCFSDDEDPRKSPSKKPSKKHDSPTREKPSSKQQRERLGSRDEGPIGDKNPSTDDKLQNAMAFAAQYVQETKNKASKSPPKAAQDMPAYSAAYPDPSEKFAAAAKRRGSGDAKHAKGEPGNVDVSGPSKETANVSPTHQGPPRLQKSYTMPSGQIPQAHPTAPSVPARGGPMPGLMRSYTMQPDHSDGAGGRSSGEKYRSSRRRASFDEDDHYDDRHAYQPRDRVRKYSVNRDKGAAPRTMETKYRDPYAPSPGATFSKVKTAPAYGPEHVSTAKRYGNDEVLTTDYKQPTYTDYPTQAAY
ncbi:hypothetical protein VMCG_10240 [Cytospora schulzeri]|uniref:J domain-containing protein n=1 Tax=Cytospora schulzeri TaxID=448051 RepID=A0A423VH66_9PEZI|nr:hypothetical protein VMCG_10240 [Valsa malicola]